MRRGIIALLLGCAALGSAQAQVSVGVGVNLPGVSIGINIPSYPQLVRVPSYPVYYAPGLDTNFFFYDGMYWVYESDNWYASSWYNGPWSVVGPEFVPVYVLRIPVRYYRDPPMYFRDWRPDAPPRWGDHWGRGWEQQRSGWDRWNRGAAPAPAPLPVYQRQYGGSRYPQQVEQQRRLQSQNYRYQPRDAVVRERLQPPVAPREPRHTQQPVPRVEAPAPRGREDVQRSNRADERAAPGRAVSPPPEPRAPRQQMQERPAPPAARPAQRGPEPGAQAPQERRGQGHGQGQEKDRDRGEGRGQDKKN